MSAPPPPPPPLPAGPEGAAPAAPANSTHSTVYVGHLSPRTERRDVEELVSTATILFGQTWFTFSG
ncbi:hypothetical protein K457DRAFT_642474 [Linnemannia elongata AG-77]|uniref:RRM domain-containing protein n=1 Tax=Linnemannia elongata AG-77 TaxID=1314771 RepID=A0A197JS06_9FUNG|nr:hypothetical protein K457DRAFT_642474 [Linnemannia elongata AG-77]